MKEILNIVKLNYKQPEMRSAILISSLTGAATLTYAWFVQPYFIEAGVPVRAALRLAICVALSLESR